jgi:hypothetical protein
VVNLKGEVLGVQFFYPNTPSTIVPYILYVQYE